MREKWDEIVQAGLRCNLFRGSEGFLIWIRSSVVDMFETCFKWLLAKGCVGKETWTNTWNRCTCLDSKVN